MNNKKEQICECEHHKNFHDIGEDGRCIYGLEFSSISGINRDKQCKCKEFKIK